MGTRTTSRRRLLASSAANPSRMAEEGTITWEPWNHANHTTSSMATGCAPTVTRTTSATNPTASNAELPNLMTHDVYLCIANDTIHVLLIHRCGCCCYKCFIFTYYH